MIRQATDEERKLLERWARSSRTSVRLQRRARIVLALLDGKTTTVACREVGVGAGVIKVWRERFNALGPRGLEKDRARRVPPGLGAAKIDAVLHATLHTKPRGATHWTTRTMAEAQGISQSAVHRIWRAHNLKPHLVSTFKLSTDPQFAEKVEDVVGLYINPPDNAIVLSVDEKSQIQALDRTQPGLPLKQGRCGTMTHDYKRNGTTTLFSALELSSGAVITGFEKRHRHQEFLRFIKRIEADTPANLALHVILDNYATHKHPTVRRWLDRNKRVHFHFIPTSSSWLNLVERWFRDLTEKALRRGAFASVAELIAAIDDYTEVWNDAPRPFVWRKTAQQIMVAVMRGRDKLASLH
jgi:transposase